MRYRSIFPLLALALSFAAPAAADVRVAVMPESVTLAPGDTVTLTLAVPVSGSAFNGFDATVSYDPAALTFLPTSPTSLQEGAYMQSTCGAPFHRFSAAGDSLAITEVLLCAGASLTGPGTLYTLRFRASNTPQVTHVRLRYVQFYNAGVFVGPAIPSDATLAIGVTLSVPPGRVPALASVRPLANPARGALALEIDAPAGHQQLVLFDAAGRRARTLGDGDFPAGRRIVRWDGRDEAGRRLPPGGYLAVLTTPGSRVSAHIAWLP